MADRPVPGRVWLGPAPPIGAPRTHAILSQVLVRVFSELQISVSLLDGQTWYPIHSAPTLTSFEMNHGVEEPRWEYNARCFERARREHRPVLGEYAGFFDVFSSIAGAGSWALVAGPFAIKRPTSGDILTRWRALTGTHGHVSDPEFLHYVSTTLETATLEGRSVHVFQRVIGCLSKLLGGRGNPDRLAVEVLALTEALSDVRFAERMYSATSSIVDERTASGWLSLARARDLVLVGAKRLPQHAIVGLLLGRPRDADPVDDILQRNAFQRACVDLARKRGGCLCGRISDHGIVLLVDEPGSGTRLRSKLSDVCATAANSARRFGLKLHLGVSAPDAPSPLPARYQSALSAAEQALSREHSLLFAERSRPSVQSAHGDLRRQLVAAVAERPSLLLPQFDRYLEALKIHCGYRLEPLHAHLDAALDLVTDALHAMSALGDKDLFDWRAAILRSVDRANTVSELSAAFRAGIAEIELELQRPERARHARSITRATAFVRDHLAEPLTVARVAHVSGFAPRYFAKLFAESEGKTFHDYVVGLRLERAKRMLASTTLSVERVGQLTGFPTRSHFHRAFRRAVGMSPVELRRRKR